MRDFMKIYIKIYVNISINKNSNYRMFLCCKNAKLDITSLTNSSNKSTSIYKVIQKLHLTFSINMKLFLMRFYLYILFYD